MLKKILYTFIIISATFSCDVSASLRSTKSIDPEEIKHRPLKTQNGKGMNFNNLGAFEKDFIRECRGLELADEGVQRILIKGAAYGRLAMRALRETYLTHIVVNELSTKNLEPLVSKLFSMSRSKNITEKAAVDRMSLLPGDCLELPSNPQLSALLNDTGPDNSFDLIMCANVLHFFDGEQVLKFFINTFNFLKPGGKAYIFTDSSTRTIPANNFSPPVIYMKATFAIIEAAKKDPSILFPGLIHDKWLQKSPFLKEILKRKPNGLGLANYIPEQTLQFISDQLGFETISKTYYSAFLVDGSAIIKEEDGGPHYGLILRKPADYGDTKVTMENLDPTFVAQCLGAQEKMKRFIETEIDFPAKYPFVKAKIKDKGKEKVKE